MSSLRADGEIFGYQGTKGHENHRSSMYHDFLGIVYSLNLGIMIVYEHNLSRSIFRFRCLSQPCFERVSAQLSKEGS